MNFRSLLLTIFISSGIIAQQFKHDFVGGYSGRAGNTDFQYWNVSYSLTSYGDISLGSTTLKDSEFLLAFEKNLLICVGTASYAGQAGMCCAPLVVILTSCWSTC